MHHHVDSLDAPTVWSTIHPDSQSVWRSARHLSGTSIWQAAEDEAIDDEECRNDIKHKLNDLKNMSYHILGRSDKLDCA